MRRRRPDAGLVEFELVTVPRDAVDPWLKALAGDARLSCDVLKVEGIEGPLNLLPPDKRAAARDRRGLWVRLLAGVLLVLLAVALPLAGWLNGPERDPAGDEDADRAAKLRGWSRGQVLRDGLFYLMMAGILAPGFIGTTIFFHQVYLIELRGWSREAFAIAFMALAGMTLVSGLVAGYMIDRFSATRLLPGFLLPCESPN